MPSANRLPFRRFDFAGEDSRRIELNREVTQTNRLSLFSRLKNEEGSCVDFLMGLKSHVVRIDSVKIESKEKKVEVGILDKIISIKLFIMFMYLC